MGADVLRKEKLMQLLIKQRVFSWTDTYDVYDEKEEPKYFVKAEFFALGHQIHVYDKSGREVGMVKQRLLTLLPAFDIEIDGKEFGSVQKEFTFFKSRYELFHTQIGVGNRLDGGRRRVKKYLWSFFRTAPAGQVRL